MRYAFKACKQNTVFLIGILFIPELLISFILRGQNSWGGQDQEPIKSQNYARRNNIKRKVCKFIVLEPSLEQTNESTIRRPEWHRMNPTRKAQKHRTNRMTDNPPKTQVFNLKITSELIALTAKKTMQLIMVRTTDGTFSTTGYYGKLIRIRYKKSQSMCVYVWGFGM